MLLNSGVGAPMTKPLTNENSNIHQICLHGELDKLSSLLIGESSKIQDLLCEKDDDGKVALHYATFSRDSIACVNLVLSLASKEYINSKDNSGWSPLHIAAWQNNVETIKLLLEKGG
jgi:ankyrin repeat protein